MTAEKPHTKKQSDSATSYDFSWVQKKLISAGVPKRYLSAKLSDFDDKSLKNLSWSDCGYFLSGVTGCGKSHLAAAMLRSRMNPVHKKTLIKNERLDRNAIGWVSCPELLTRIKSTFAGGTAETQQSIITKFSKIELLVIDDFGSEKISDWSTSAIYDLIQRRESNLLDTIVTSNCSLAEIETFEPRIASRLAAMGRYILANIDRRKADL